MNDLDHESSDQFLLNIEWQAVDPSYSTLLRMTLLIQMLVVLGGIGIFVFLMPTEIRSILLSVLAVFLLIFIWLIFIWAPKTAKRLKYALREDDINVQRGFLYWRQISVACNRIQHLEVSQGPLERYFGLAKLKIFTAGTLGSDMSLPGVKLETAQQIKSTLLKKINSEEMDDESL